MITDAEAAETGQDLLMDELLLGTHQDTEHVNQDGVVTKDHTIKRSKQQVDELPFYLIELKQFQKMVYSTIKEPETETVNVKDIIKLFRGLPSWQNHFERGTPLMNLLTDPYLYPDAKNKPE